MKKQGAGRPADFSDPFRRSKIRLTLLIHIRDNVVEKFNNKARGHCEYC